MQVTITPKMLKGNIRAIPSKSHLHRLLIATALSKNGGSVFVGDVSEDIFSTISCLNSMGADIQINNKIANIKPIVSPAISPVLDCSESGSTLRFLLPVAAAVNGNASFLGRGNLPSRPLSHLADELEKNGVKFSAKNVPLTISGKLSAGTYSIPGNISSQYITGLLFALPLLNDESSIVLTTPLESASYVDITLDVLKEFGINVIKTENGYQIPGKQNYIAPENIDVQGDWSNAAFWLTAAYLGCGIDVDGISTMSPQGDKEIINILTSFMMRDIIPSSEPLIIDAGNIPDLVPIISVAASLSFGKTIIKNAHRLKIKESNRLLTTQDALRSIGADITATDDGLEINGKSMLIGGEGQSFNDHRIAMCLAIAAIKCKNKVIINGAEAVNKSYPQFFSDYIKLGGLIDVVNDRK